MHLKAHDSLPRGYARGVQSSCKPKLTLDGRLRLYVLILRERLLSLCLFRACSQNAYQTSLPASRAGTAPLHSWKTSVDAGTMHRSLPDQDDLVAMEILTCMERAHSRCGEHAPANERVPGRARGRACRWPLAGENRVLLFRGRSSQSSVHMSSQRAS